MGMAPQRRRTPSGALNPMKALRKNSGNCAVPPALCPGVQSESLAAGSQRTHGDGRRLATREATPAPST